MDKDLPPRLMSVKNASKYLAISERKLWSMTKAGDLPAARLGKSVRYDRCDLDDFIRQAKYTTAANG